MKKDDIDFLVGKTISIRVKNNFNYRGLLVSITEDSLKLQDIKTGLMLIALDDIASIGTWTQ